MTEQVPLKAPTKENLQVARSCLLDSFADVEASIITLQAKLEIKATNATLGQRLDALRKIKASPQLSKAKLTALHEFVARLAELNRLRGDVVHARMWVAPIAGEVRACFVNSLEAAEEFPSARLLTLSQCEAVGRELREIASRLTTWEPKG